MDHWGDPWADDADADAAVPKQDEVASPSKPSFSAAPVLLNSFLDDAQWGSNDDEGFGAWEQSAGDPDLALPSAPGARVADPSPTSSATESPDAIQLGEGAEKRGFDLEDEGWGSLAHEEEALKELDNVVSETSDSATTIQPDETPERVSHDISNAVRHDDELSTRPSTSPSDVSHTEAPPTESPRTSFEDERIAGTSLEASGSTHEDGTKLQTGLESSASPQQGVGSESEGSNQDDFGDFGEDTNDKIEEVNEDDPVLESPGPPVLVSTAEKTGTKHNAETKRASVTVPASLPAFNLDKSLLNELFSPTKPSKETLDTPDDPISTTSTRKAWYRLTRKQSMREYNIGMDDDNYVRVTWANSHIREDVKKIVHRWTTEDRMLGRGHSAGASFYWDSSPANVPATHTRKKSIVPTSPIQSAKPQVPPLSTNVPAAFNWSSAPPADDPWRQDSPGIRSISSPIAAKHNATSRTEAQESRSVSVDLTPRTPVIATHERTPTVDASKRPAPCIPAPKPSMESDPWATLDQLDTSSHTNATNAINADDDDEWGEMVESPAVSMTPTATNFPQSASHDPTVTTPYTTPQSIKSIRSSPLHTQIPPLQPQASRHASPIVRLKGTVSPTSSAFRFSSFVPVGTDAEPIGQGILKRKTKTADSTPAKVVPESAPTPTVPTPVQGAEPTKPILEREESDDFTAFESSVAQPEQKPTVPDDFSSVESPTLRSAPPPISTSTPAPEPIKPATPTLPTPSSTPTPISHPSAQTPTSPWFTASPTLATHPAPSQTPVDPWISASPVIASHAALAHTSAVDADPWATADFSFFESSVPAAPPTVAQSALSPSDPWAVFNAPVTAAPVIPVQPPAPAAPKAIPGTVSNFEQRRKKEEEDIIRGIVSGLPDLGYMLR